MARLVVRILPLVCCIFARAEDLQTQLDAVVRGANREWFMGTILIARGETVLFQKCYGSANLKEKIPISRTTRFNIGSLTKQFTAAAVLLLEERGKLRTSDLITNYLAEAPAAWKAITIYHLLTHTSGIPDYVNTPEFDNIKAKQFTPQQLLRIFRDKALDFRPGDKEDYSNSNYVLLGLLIEKVSGQSYADFLQANLFVPLGMADSGVGTNTSLPRGLATGYLLHGQELAQADIVNFSSVYAAGAIYSTAQDLQRWQDALFNGKVLSAKALKKMTTPNLSGYACGLHVEASAEGTLIYHGGRIDGFSAHSAYYRKTRLSVITLSNVWNREMATISKQLGEAVLRSSNSGTEENSR